MEPDGSYMNHSESFMNREGLKASFQMLKAPRRGATQGDVFNFPLAVPERIFLCADQGPGLRPEILTRSVLASGCAPHAACVFTLDGR
jgi:hypothetical protein